MERTAQRRILGLLAGLFWFCRFVYNPHLTTYLSDAGFSAETVGAIIGGYGMSQILFRLPVGILADRRGTHARSITCGLALIAASSLLFLAGTSFALAFLANFFCGLGTSVWISFATLYPTFFPESENTVAMARLNRFNDGGRLLSFAVSALVVAFLSRRVLFLVSALVGCMAVFISLPLRGLDAGNSAPKPPPGFYRRLFGHRKLLALSTLGAFTQFVIFSTFMSFVSTRAAEAGCSNAAISLFTLAFPGAAVVLEGLMGRAWFKRLPAGGVCAAAFAALALAVLALPLCTRAWQFGAAQFAGGSCAAVLLTYLMACGGQLFPRESRASALGVFQAVYALGTTLGPMLMGVLIQQMGFAAGCAIIGGFTVAASICCGLQTGPKSIFYP